MSLFGKSSASTIVLDEQGHPIDDQRPWTFVPHYHSGETRRIEVYDDNNLDQRSQLNHDLMALRSNEEYRRLCNGGHAGLTME